jgi:hypothetical protein
MFLSPNITPTSPYPPRVPTSGPPDTSRTHPNMSEEPDRFIWKWPSNGEFSSSLAYRALFSGRTSLAGADRIWKVQAPDRSFLWLARASRSLLDFEPVTSAWDAWLRYLCTLCTGGRNFGPPTSRVSIAGKRGLEYCVTTPRSPDTAGGFAILRLLVRC